MLMRLCVIALACALFSACDDGNLRGTVTKSPDGRTYFGIADSNGGNCGPLLVDGVTWPHPVGKLVPFEPGPHTVSCGTEIAFVVPAGVAFKFDYWGP